MYEKVTFCFAVALAGSLTLAQSPTTQFDVLDILGYGAQGPTSGVVTGADGSNRFYGQFTNVAGIQGFIFQADTKAFTNLGFRRPKRADENGTYAGTSYENPNSPVAFVANGTTFTNLAMPANATQSFGEDTDGNGTVVGAAFVGSSLKPVIWVNGTPEILPLPGSPFVGGEAFAVTPDGRVYGEIFELGVCRNLTIWAKVNGAWTITHANCPALGGYQKFLYRGVTDSGFVAAELTAHASDPNNTPNRAGRWNSSGGFEYIYKSGPLNTIPGKVGSIRNDGLLVHLRTDLSPNADNWHVSWVNTQTGIIPQFEGTYGIGFGGHPFWGPVSPISNIDTVNGVRAISGSETVMFYGSAKFQLGNTTITRPALFMPKENVRYVSGLIDFGNWNQALDSRVKLVASWRYSSTPLDVRTADAQLYDLGDGVYRYSFPVPVSQALIDCKLSLSCERSPGQKNTWLDSRIDSTAGSPQGYTINFTSTNALLQGDIVPDAVIDLSDYTGVATHFEAESSSSNWAIPDASGISPQMCDLNHDGVVDLTDYTIIAQNFNKLGDSW